MSCHTPYIVVFSFISLVVTAPSLSYAEQKLQITPIAFGEKVRFDHQTKRISGPAIQLSDTGIFHLSWIEANQKDLNTYYVQAPLQPEVLPNPIRVNPKTTLAASLHAPPAMVLGVQDEVYLQWTTPHPKADGKLFTSLLLLSRSLDGGKSFLDPIQVNDDDVVTGHSFDNLTVSPNGSIHMVWLDAREGKKDPSTYSSFSQDQGQTLSPNLKIDDMACVCCRTHATVAQDGTVYLAWRKIYPGGIRETVVASSTNNGATFSAPVIVGNDRWAFEGCPHRPATMGTDQQGRLFVTWYTEGPDDIPGVYIAYSDDRGKTFTPRRQLNLSKGTFPDHPQLAVDRDGRLLVIWEEQSPVRREVVISYSLDRGATFSSPQKLNTKKSKHPAVAINTNGQAILAWQEQIKFPGWHTVVQPITWPNLAATLLSSHQP